MGPPHSPSLMLLFVVLLLCVARHGARATSSFSRQEDAIEILFPSSGINKKMDMAMADFGRPKYGGFLIGKIVYPTEDERYRPASMPALRCKGNIACQFGCSDFGEAAPPFHIPKVPGQFNIMLVDRGPAGADPPCWLVSKAYYAQKAGADAVLIANEDDAGLVTAVVPEEEEVAELLDQLTISAALITKSDGKRLKDLYKANDHVTVKISWTDLIPQSSKVHMELWTNSNDECGTLCDEQIEFIHDMKPIAIALQQAGVLEFEPHYLLWSCPLGLEDSTECKNSCILGGKYCAPDPDGSITSGASGKDVLEYNIRQLCFARVAAKDGKPWLWWDFSEGMFAECSIKSGKYSLECVDQVFNEHGGPMLMSGSGLSEWQGCVSDAEDPDKSTRFSRILDEELEAQHGKDGEASVAILPTIRINHQQYRGTLEYKSVTRAICAAFPKDSEPSLCNQGEISDNECEMGSPGYEQCRVGDPNTLGRTRCINTFRGYKCDCGQGWLSSTNPETGEEVCEDVNECLATSIPMKDSRCSCSRCACINLPGSYTCTGELQNKCTRENNYNGCWSAKMDDGKLYHACKENLAAYKSRASKGILEPNEDWTTCACPACFSTKLDESKNKICQPNCPMSQCSKAQGMCLPGPVPSGDGKSSSQGGSSWGAVLLAVVLSVALTSLLLYAVYARFLRQRMHGEMMDIMSQYMPLGGGNEPESRSRRGGGGPPPGGGGDGGEDPLLAMEAGGRAQPASSTYVPPNGANGAVEDGGGAVQPAARHGSNGAQIPLSSIKEAHQQQEREQEQRQQEKRRARAQQAQAQPVEQHTQLQGSLVGEEEGGTGAVKPLVFDGDSSQGPL